MYAAGWEDHSRRTVVADACMLGRDLMLGSALHWPGTLELLGGTALPSGWMWQWQALGNGSLGNWAPLLQSSVLCLSGDRLAEKPVAD